MVAMIVWESCGGVLWGPVGSCEVVLSVGDGEGFCGVIEG